jgi:hypothetical protein
MRATKAYIASLGTTGVLLAASILMLAVVSAVVAFDRWPDGDISTRVQTLVLDENAAPIPVSTHSAARSATPHAGSGARVPTQRSVTTGGTDIVRQRFSAGTTTPDGTPARPLAALPPAATKPAQPVQDTATPIVDAVSNPSTTASRLADGAQAVTDAAGGSVGRVNPQVADAVAGTGQAAADTVRQLPLPDHVLP